MPRLALALCFTWFATLFAFRALLQWRQTGSTGVKGFHGAVGSLPWLAGMAASLGLLLTPLAALATLRGWPGAALLVHHDGLHLAGAGLGVLGMAGALAAQLSMGSAWRVGVDASERTELVTDGPFARVRNPIFTCIGVSLLGLLLLVPSPLALAGCALCALGIELQVRAVEEPHLARMHGDAYARYAAEVGRFLPRIGRWQHG